MECKKKQGRFRKYLRHNNKMHTRRRKATRDSRVRLPRKEYTRSRHQRLFEENVGKTGKDVVYELKMKGSGVVFMHGEGIRIPHVHHKRRQPLIKYSNMTLCYFAFLRSYVFLRLFIFLSFCDQRGCFPCSYVFLNCDKEIRPT